MRKQSVSYIDVNKDPGTGIVETKPRKQYVRKRNVQKNKAKQYEEEESNAGQGDYN